ncbi:MAG: COQ9 family protein [Alphaproteobacteria bacterium]|nr:MAG: COQ9 family protein [Alphaproteobacteria bacterium]
MAMNDTENTDHLAPIRAKLLDSAIEHVPFDGWSKTSLRRAAQENDVSEGLAELAFPSIRDLVIYYIDQVDADMVAALSDHNLADMRIRDRITLAVRSRIEALFPYREAERRALAYMVLPQNAGASARCLYTTVDLMWRTIGDKSTDFNFYTKRVTLTGVYSATLLYWLSDLSEDYEDTWAFLDRRIDDVMKIEKAKAKMRGVPGDSEGPSILGLLAKLRYGTENRMKP